MNLTIDLNDEEDSLGSAKHIGVIHLVLSVSGSILGLFFIFMGYQLRSTYERVQAWPSVQAVVTQHEVKEDKPAPNSKYRNWTPFSPIWHYSFQVGESNFNSHSQSYPGATILTFKKTQEETLQELAKHGVGQTLTIFYNPEDPQQTILEKWPRNNTKEFLIYSVGLTLIIISLLVPRLLRRR